jgi:hypothetical protein
LYRTATDGVLADTLLVIFRHDDTPFSIHLSTLAVVLPPLHADESLLV